MSEAVVDDIVAVLPPLLQSLEALSFIARYLNPPDFDRVMAAAGEPDTALRAIRPRLAQWPAEFAHIKTPLETASDAALAAFEALRVVQNGHGDFVSLFRALRYAPRAQEALYALSARLPPVNQFFVDPALHGDTDLAARLQRQWPRLSLELAARRPQPRRDPDRTDRYRQHLGADGRRYRYAESRA